MTNSIFQRKRVITPERAAIILPTLISSFFVFIIVSIFIIPRYVKSNKVESEYKEFLRKKDELPQLKAQYKIINEKLKNLNNAKLKIINLVSGKSNLETFLERVEFIGIKNEIKILSISPKNVVSYIPVVNDVNQSSNSNIKNNEVDIISDPLLSEGVKKYTLDVSFDSNFYNLLSFLRELEFQESVILFRDLKLKLKNDFNNNEADYNQENILQVSMRMIVYGKNQIKKE